VVFRIAVSDRKGLAVHVHDVRCLPIAKPHLRRTAEGALGKDAQTWANCVNPPPGATFYPIYTSSLLHGKHAKGSKHQGKADIRPVQHSATSNRAAPS